jgi:spermidine synthase
VRACLAKDGMAMFQIGSFLDFENLVLKTYNRAKAIFPHVAIYRFTIPCYHCGDYCFIGVSKKLNICNPELGVLEARSKGFQFNFYSANMHLNSLALPAIYQKKIK